VQFRQLTHVQGNGDHRALQESWRGLRPQPKFANANRSPSDPASVRARLISYNTKTLRGTPSTDLVSNGVDLTINNEFHGSIDPASVVRRLAGYSIRNALLYRARLGLTPSTAIVHMSLLPRDRGEKVAEGRMRGLTGLLSNEAEEQM